MGRSSRPVLFLATATEIEGAEFVAIGSSTWACGATKMKCVTSRMLQCFTVAASTCFTVAASTCWVKTSVRSVNLCGFALSSA